MTLMARQSYLSDMLGSPHCAWNLKSLLTMIWINSSICFMLAKDDEMYLVPLSCFSILSATHECLFINLILSPTTLPSLLFTPNQT